MNGGRVVFMGLVVIGAMACPVRGQQQSQDQAATSTGDSTTAKPKPKKVWTNENMGDVTGTISVVGSAQQKPTTSPSKISSFQPAAPTAPSGKQGSSGKSGDGEVDAKTLAQVKQQVQKLQAGLDQLDKQIDQLKGLSRGDSKNTGGLNPDTWSYSTASIPDQIKSLEAKRSAMQASMDNLLDAARANLIEPGQLR
jgi:hypothetical protein